jgi:ABC-type phosphate/phosphonate transport system substrate-binding protein
MQRGPGAESCRRVSRIAGIPAALALLVPALLAGCQHQQPLDLESVNLFAPLEKLLQIQPPVRLGVTRIHINPLVTPPWQRLEQELKRILGRNVQVLQLKPFQIRAKMGLGQLDFALVSASDYLEIAARPVCQIIAVPVNPDMSLDKRGLIVTAQDSGIESLDQLKGKRFAFGPADDPVLFLAPADALIRAGVNLSDLTKELLPPFGFHISSFEAAKAVLYEGVQAGAVDQQEFTSWPETTAALFQTALPRQRFRILAKTEPVPNGPFLAGSKTDPKMVQRVRKYLLEEVKSHPDVLAGLGAGGFQAADASLYDAFGQMMARVRPQLPTGLFTPAAPTSAPQGPAE